MDRTKREYTLSFAVYDVVLPPLSTFTYTIDKRRVRVREC